MRTRLNSIEPIAFGCPVTGQYRLPPEENILYPEQSAPYHPALFRWLKHPLTSFPCALNTTGAEVENPLSTPFGLKLSKVTAYDVDSGPTVKFS